MATENECEVLNKRYHGTGLRVNFHKWLRWSNSSISKLQVLLDSIFEQTFDVCMHMEYYQDRRSIAVYLWGILNRIASCIISSSSVRVAALLTYISTCWTVRTLLLYKHM